MDKRNCLLTVNDSAISGNSAILYGGGIFNNGTLTVNESALSGNSTGGGGGGIYNNGTQLVRDSTLSGNSTGGDGGGIYNNDTAVLTNTTIVSNTASNGGGIYNTGNGVVLTLTNSIAAYNGSGGNCYVNSGSIVDNGYNLDSGNSCGLSAAGSLANTDPLLAPLGDYLSTGSGQAAQTHALLPGSPAIDAGDNAACDSSDQRGESRVGTCDIGAFESQGFVLAINGGNNQSTVVNTAFSSPLAVAVTANVSAEPVGAGGVISFSAPGSGAGLATQTFTAATDSSGAAGASVTANGITGSYVVAATAAGVSSPVTFTLTNIAADLIISKAVDPATASPGETITYTLTFSNAGEATATGVVITDEIPSQLSVISYQLSVDSGVTLTRTAGITCEWMVSDLASGEGGVITITGQISSGVGAGTFINTAAITAIATDGNSDNNSAEASVEVIILPDLAITKSVDPTTAAPGEAITYTIVIANSGGADANNVTVQDPLPAGISGAGLDWTGSVTANESLTFTISANIINSGPYYGVTITNTAAYTYNTGTGSAGAAITTISDITAPTFTTAPVLITPTGGIVITDLRPAFDWEDATDDLSGVVSYTLLITGSNDSLSAQEASDTVTTTVSSFTPSVDLVAGVYTWTVRAHDAVGNVSDYVSPAETFVIETTVSSSDIYLPIVVKDN